MTTCNQSFQTSLIQALANHEVIQLLLNVSNLLHSAGILRRPPLRLCTSAPLPQQWLLALAQTLT